MSRLRWIGDLELRYEEGARGWLDNRPKYIVLPDKPSQLTEEHIGVLRSVRKEQKGGGTKEGSE
jgi:hypothetical protein